MFTIDDVIEHFAEPDFNPREEAQTFFKSNSEAEVTKKVNEMTGIQVTTQATVLTVHDIFTVASEKHRREAEKDSKRSLLSLLEDKRRNPRYRNRS